MEKGAKKGPAESEAKENNEPNNNAEPAADAQGAIKAVEIQFAAAMAAQGYGDHYIPADGDWHGFPFPDDGNGKEHGSAKLTLRDSGPDGVVRDWRQGNSPIFTWDGNGCHSNFSDEEKAAIAQRNAEKKKA